MASARSPLSGCTIVIAALLVLIFLIGFSIWVPFRQADEIEKFTRTTPAPVPVAEADAVEAETLDTRLKDFRKQLDAANEARIGLDRDDLNLAIARYQPLEALRGTFHVREIRDGKMLIDINYQINGRPRLARDDEEGWIASDPRYLVGTITGSPVLTDRELVLRVDELDVPDGEVAEGFMGHFSTLRLFENSRTDPELGPAMAALTSASLQGGKLVLERDPAARVPGTVTDEEFSAGGKRVVIFLGAAAVGFLIVAATVLILGYRRQLARIQADEEANPTDPDA